MFRNYAFGERRLISSEEKKLLYATNNNNYIIMHFPEEEKNDVWRNYLSGFSWEILDNFGIKTHYIQKLNIREQLVKSTHPYPFSLKVTNISSPEINKLIGVPEGTKFDKPLVEWYLTQDSSKNLISQEHIVHFEVTTKEEAEQIKNISLRVNDVISSYFLSWKLYISEITLKFGKNEENLVLIDEISPETCKFWNKELDTEIPKDEAYEKMKEIYKKTNNHNKSDS
ncbi:phosphoribosylaminoimidazolesuccinocarboxamide synthase [Candidatus Nesciobacter abundans]|uniref:phosphoribosylaminoimidazolesuccinocarboxamide synthase n=1 Tax=Candidatus Nesciobacter abundans TaxID=2601668 RepID=A0A5C0UGL4_9PROT|nr:phosphoribosylaminoimidazolesuccinocarboxamide synthase [Candidatus Nesciobacter abundans]QEK38870.1 hypothetical protein FZC36_00230 [Candidatus Nesciobacter abundans]